MKVISHCNITKACAWYVPWTNFSDDMAVDVAQREHSNIKCYAL